MTPKPTRADAEPASAPDSGTTIEADTVALAEQEASTEAALEGLRTRTAAHAAKRPGTGGQPLAPAPAPPPQPVAAGAPVLPPASPDATDVGEAPKRGIWVRFVVGAVLIIVTMATATVIPVFVLGQDLVQGLGGLGGLQHQLENADPGKPQTILILGSDRRPGETDSGRSDTTILLRVSSDPAQINLLSIPRDLKVFIPGHGVDKFNAAYTYGGPKLTVQTVHQLTGIKPNVVVNINFTGFANAVNEIGCVYVDVDHHYYHSNAGLSAEEQYAELDIPSGYQRMCGFNALSYVRYRHDDNDLVRAARQQAFLREARAQVPATKFLSDYDNLTNIFKKATTSTITSVAQLFGLANLFVGARGAQVREIHFPADAGGPTDTYLTASSSAIKQVVSAFLGEAPTTQSTPATSTTSKGKKPSSGGKSKNAKNLPESNLNGHQESDSLVDASSAGQAAAAYATTYSPKQGPDKPTGVPVYYPTKLPPSAEFLTPDVDGDPDNTRGFVIDGGGGQAYYGYKIVAQIPYGSPGYNYTDYFGFSGTNWRDAPILDNPTLTKTVNGHDFMFYYDNGRLRQIAWRTNDAAYWVENDLLETLTQDQMLGMAESMVKYTG